MDERLESGNHRAHWDGRNGDGRAVGSGVYLAVMPEAGTPFPQNCSDQVAGFPDREEGIAGPMGVPLFGGVIVGIPTERDPAVRLHPNHVPEMIDESFGRRVGGGQFGLGQGGGVVGEIVDDQGGMDQVQGIDPLADDHAHRPIEI